MQEIRLERIGLKPMSLEEARLQLGCSGRSFQLFKDECSGRISVLHVRRDGLLGLIEAEPG